MNDELMNRARELLALRDKATPGPMWVERFADGTLQIHGNLRVISDDESAYTVIVESMTRKDDSAFIAAAHDMADTISDLLAKVELLEKDRAHYHGVAAGYAILAEAAESSLCKLASAEAVAWAKFDGTEITHMEMSDGSGADFDLVGSGFVPLIRRPEMP